MRTEYNRQSNHHQPTIAVFLPYHWLARTLKWPRLLVGGHFVFISSVRATFRTPWKRCCFSGDGEYIVAGSARQHALYIWEKSIGNLVKILHGTRGELLLDVAVRDLSFRSEIVILFTIKRQDNHSRGWLCLIGCISFFLCLWPLSVASCASNHCLHLQRSCVHLGSEPSGEWK